MAPCDLIVGRRLALLWEEYGHQWPSVAISGNPCPSVAISGNPCPSVAISGNQWPSVAIDGTQHQWYSEVSEAIDETRLLRFTREAMRVAIRGNQWPSEAIDETHLRDEYGFQSRMQLRERRLGQAQAAELLVDLRRRVGRRVARALDEGSIAPQGIACIEHERVEARDVLMREAIRCNQTPIRLQSVEARDVLMREAIRCNQTPIRLQSVEARDVLMREAIRCNQLKRGMSCGTRFTREAIRRTPIRLQSDPSQTSSVAIRPQSDAVSGNRPSQTPSEAIRGK